MGQAKIKKVRLKEAERVKTIEYINATPAAGKTYEATQIMLQHLKDDGKHIIVYAAPTHRLLEEVYDKFDKADLYGDTPIDGKVLYLDGKQVVVQYAYLMGLVTEQEAESCIEKQTFEELKAAYATCRVILCTHECIVRAAQGDSKRASTAMVIFDEARQCVVEEVEIKVSAEELLTVKKVFDLTKQATPTETVERDGEAHTASLFSLAGGGFPSPQKLMSAFKVKVLEDLPKCAKNLYKMRKVCDGKRADILVEILEPKDKSKRTAYLIGVARPSAVFGGYGRVLIMSAYFEHSQMYHLLLNAHLGHQDGREMFRLVRYKTSTDFSKRGDRVVSKSLEKIRIGTMLSGRTQRLTASMLSSGLIIPTALQDIIQQKQSAGKKLPTKAKIVGAAFAGTRINVLGVAGNAMLHESANPPLLQLHKIAAEILSANKVTKALCFINAFGSNATGTRFKLGSSEFDPVVKPGRFLHNLPGSLTSEAYKPERRFMTDGMLAHLEKSKDLYVIPPTTSVLGLNEYDHLHGFVHLAALNPKPSVARVLKRIMPGYEPDLDYAISNIIQTMYRTSLRTLGKDLVYCVVLTEWIIEQIERVCFGGKRLKRIDYAPKHCALDFQSVDRKQKSRAGKNKRKYEDNDSVIINNAVNVYNKTKSAEVKMQKLQIINAMVAKYNDQTILRRLK